jgi:putative tricarboxylic transport membrane protein
VKQKLFAVGWFCFSVLYLAGGWGLNAGTPQKPGPGFLPRIVGVGLLVLTGLYLWQTLRKPGEPQNACGPFHLKSVLGLAAGLMAYPFLLFHLNFILATFLVVYTMLWILKYKGPVWDSLIAISLAVMSFSVFALGLGVSLPSGPIEEIFYRLRG